MIRKPQKAWELYMKMETSAESFNLLQLIANDCYRVSITITYSLKTMFLYRWVNSYIQLKHLIC